MNETEQQLQEWSAACSQCLGGVYDICRKYHEPECRDLHPQVRFVVAQLAISCHLTSESTFILIGNRKIWDADILVRSVIEGTFKYVYILNGDQAETERRCAEYWDVLPDFSILTRQRRAMALLDEVGDPDSPEWAPIRELLVSDEELSRATRSTNRRDRQMLSHKWSFTSIAQYFATHPDSKYHGIGCLAYCYGMQSHLVHQDGDGVGMRWERACRGDKRREAIELAHGARVISDLCHFAFFRAMELFRACGKDTQTVRQFADGYGDLFEGLSAAAERWQRIEYET